VLIDVLTDELQHTLLPVAQCAHRPSLSDAALVFGTCVLVHHNRESHSRQLRAVAAIRDARDDDLTAAST
jgi:hypothetical protein